MAGAGGLKEGGKHNREEGRGNYGKIRRINMMERGSEEEEET